MIVFENLAFDWLPQWHYAIVFGYDLNKEEILMHSGPEDSKLWDIRKFERSWSLGDYWGLVIFAPDQLSASAGEIAHLNSAASLEQIGMIEAAEKAYQKILRRWPQSLAVQMGLANIAYTKKDYKSAREIFNQAKRDHPESSIVWHNSAIADAALGDYPEARRSAAEALRLARPESRADYEKSLRNWLQEP